ncbi:hypothetical protein GCM10027347_46780 [Larkinella harenae]
MKTLTFYFIGIAFTWGVVSCTSSDANVKRTFKDEIPAEAPLPIDGAYKVNSPTTFDGGVGVLASIMDRAYKTGSFSDQVKEQTDHPYRVRIEGGRIYVIDAIPMVAKFLQLGTVIVKDLHETSPGVYTGVRLPLHEHDQRTFKTELFRVNDSTLTQSIAIVPEFDKKLYGEKIILRYTREK